MGIIGNKSHEIMSRKEYLKNKKRQKYSKFRIIPVLLLFVVIGLSIYVYKQLQVYNTVTKFASNIIEENALKDNKRIYYIGESYTKEKDTQLIYFDSLYDSRTIIESGTNIEKIQINDNNIFGLIDGKLYKIDKTTHKKTLVLDKKIKGYLISNDNIYLYINTTKSKGIFKIIDGKEQLIIQGEVYQMVADDKNLYVVTEADTLKSIVRYDLEGKNKKILTNKQIVSNIFLGNNSIYYSNRSDNNKIYYISKNGKKSGKLTDNQIISYARDEAHFNNNNIMIEKDNFLYFIANNNNNVFRINLESLKQELIIEKQINTIQSVGDKIYYTKIGDIGIYCFDETNNYSEKITSARTNEYLLIK